MFLISVTPISLIKMKDVNILKKPPKNLLNWTKGTRQLFSDIGEKGNLHYELIICPRSLSVDNFLAMSQESMAQRFC